MKRPLTRILLGLSGLIGLVIGTAILFAPITFGAINGVVLDKDASSLSEVRAPAGFLIASALFTLFASIRGRSTQTALLLAGAVYGTYGLSRLVGVIFDGLPSEPLVHAMIAELAIGALCLIALLRLQAPRQMTLQQSSRQRFRSPKIQGDKQ